MTGPEFPVLEVRGPVRTGPPAGGALAVVLGSGLPSTRQLLESFGPLAQSVAAAHRHGLALGCAHPSRILRAVDGRLEMAITPTPPGATMDQDVQGLGAVLYALLTGCWPLPATDADLGGLPRAPRDRSGAPVAPALVRHGLAPELAALSMAALGAGVDRSHARIRTAAAIGRVVGDLRAEWSCEVLPPQDHTGAGQRDLWRSGSAAPAGGDPGTAGKLSLGLAGLALGTLAVLCFLGYEAASMLGVGPTSPPRVVVGANIASAAVPTGVLPPPVMAVVGPSALVPPILVSPGAVPPVAPPPALGAAPGSAPSAGQWASGGHDQRVRAQSGKKKKKSHRSDDEG